MSEEDVAFTASQEYMESEAEEEHEETVEEEEEEDEEEDNENGDESRSPKKRKMEHESSEIGANCFVARPEFMEHILSSSTDGAVFGFAADMEGVANIPKLTFLHMLGVLLVLNSEDDMADILADAHVECKPVSKRSTRVQSCTVKHVRKGGDGSIGDLFRLNANAFRKAVLEMEASVEQGGGDGQYFGGEGNKTTEPMTNGKVFLTAHNVEYSGSDGVEKKKQVMVLWVVCHKNFDFVGKLNRLYGNSDDWRKHTTGKFEQENCGVREQQYGYWKDILYGLVQSVRLARVWRAMEQRFAMDPMHNSLNDLHPEGFNNLTNPVAVYFSIVWMLPDDAENVRVEGMNYNVLERNKLSMLEYMFRFIAWRRQFLAIKGEQRRMAEAAVKAKKGKKGKDATGEEDEAEAAAVEAEEALPEVPAAWEELVEEIEFAGEDGVMVKHILRGEPVGFFDEMGRGMNVDMLGWPLRESRADELKTGIPQPKVVLYVDFSTMGKEMAAVTTFTPSTLQGRFGDLPLLARWRIQNAMMPEHERLAESAFMSDSVSVTQAERMRKFMPSEKPLHGFIYDRVYSKYRENMLGDLLGRPDETDRLQNIASFQKSMRNMIRSDLLCGKARSLVLQSTQTYVDALHDTLGAQVYRVMEAGVLLQAEESLSDFDTYAETFNQTLWAFNQSYWGLTGRNFLLLVNFFLSEMAWRFGTSGNFKWIGMSIQVSDGAGTLETKSGMNMKKQGTCGFDYTRAVYRELRGSYVHVVPAGVLEQFGNKDAHLCGSMMRMTPGAVGDVLQIVDGKTIEEPSTELGTMLFFPEGLGDGPTVDLVVRFIPRDDSVELKMETTVDLARTGQRRKLTKEAVPGMTMCICAFARNQQPKDAETLQRMSDLLRVVTHMPSSGKEDQDDEAIGVHNEYDKKLPWTKGERNDGRASVLVGTTGSMTKEERVQYASFFSMVPMVGTLACLHQKCGIASWCISADVMFVLKQLFGMCVGWGSVLMTPLKLNHASRYFDTAICMAGVSNTVYIRSYLYVSLCGKEGRSAVEAVDHIVQVQSDDALHYTQVPGVMMRFLSGILDYQMLVVLSALFRAVEMPIIDVLSALELLSGMPVTNVNDAGRVRRYLNKCLNTDAICPMSEFDQTVRENTNCSAYVTTRRADRSVSPMRTQDVQQQQNQQTQNPRKFRQELIKKHCMSVMDRDMRDYGQFCSEFCEVSMGSALDKLAACDFNLHGLFGGGGLFYDHKGIIAALMEGVQGPRFRGIPDMQPADYVLLRVFTIGGTDVCYGLNIFSSLMLSALMRKHLKDWTVQTRTAESIVTFMVDKCVPYSLLPIKKARMDTVHTKHGPVSAEFDQGFRPLQMLRIAANNRVFDVKMQGVMDEGDGVTPAGALEDTAHMQPVYGAARRLGVTHTKLNLCAWTFEVRWGCLTDVTPLQMYPRNTLSTGDMFPEDFAAKEGKIAWVVVGERNMLHLFVADEHDGTEASSMPCGRDGAHRHEQQRFIFGLGWGPAVHPRRNGVALRGPPGESGVWTLLPHVCPTPEDMMKNGIAGLQYLQDGHYRATDGTREASLTTEEVAARLLPYGSDVAVKHDAPEMTGYARCAGQIVSRAGCPTHKKLQWAKIVLDDSVVPIFGKIPVVLKVCDGKSAVYTLRVNVDPQYVCVLDDEHGYKGCRQYIAAGKLREHMRAPPVPS